MEKQLNDYCIILAGGKGRRLWPSSRTSHPKQFTDFFGTGKTLLQTTFDRMAEILPAENIYICTTRDYKHLVKEQLPHVGDERIMVEPVNRNTAPSVALAGVTIHKRCEDARIVVVPADQLIIGEEAFRKNVEDGLRFVGENDIVLSMGIKPSRPEPGYGYIQMGEESMFAGIYKVQSFTEKPEREFATLFMESGEFLWNTGMFLMNVGHMREFFQKVIRDMPFRLSDIKNIASKEEAEDYVNKYYPAYPNVSMDNAALERNEEGYVMRCDFGWADLGTWHGIFEAMQKTEDENVVIDSEVIMENCSNNIVKLPKGHVGVINGLDGYIVAEQGDVLLICKKGDSSALIRKYVNEVGIRYGEEYI
jgi:mannose-1-phosphate guanylyltransferase